MMFAGFAGIRYACWRRGKEVWVRDSVTKKKGYQRGTNAGGDYDRGEYKTGDKLEKKPEK